jgi:hypothetical protein
MLYEKEPQAALEYLASFTHLGDDSPTLQAQTVCHSGRDLYDISISRDRGTSETAKTAAKHRPEKKGRAVCTNQDHHNHEPCKPVRTI